MPGSKKSLKYRPKLSNLDIARFPAMSDNGQDESFPAFQLAPQAQCLAAKDGLREGDQTKTKMIAGTINLENTSLTFHIPSGSDKARLTISDNLTGMERTIEVDNEQLGAIVGTSVCGTNEAVMNAAQPIAESAFPADWPNELRPMP